MNVGHEYSARRCGSTGHEILDPKGEVVAWTVDGSWAAIIVDLLERAENGDALNPHSESRPPESR